MAQISYVVSTRYKKEMSYEQCKNNVNLSLEIMELLFLCQKKLIYMHLFRAKTRLTQYYIFSEFQKLATEKFV